MKQFTCKEMSGDLNAGCDEVYEGETGMDIAMLHHGHVMATTDEAHEPLRNQMSQQGKGDEQQNEADRKKWWDWFNGEWEKKSEI